jgi:hypothetical protein
MLPYGRQSIAEDDIEAVVEVLRSDWLTQGPAVERFEQELAAVCGARYAVAVANGTAALHLACLAAGIQPGDVSLVPSITFVASANCAVYCGARPVLVDINPETLTIDADAVDSACQTQTVRAIVPVHFGADFGICTESGRGGDRGRVPRAGGTLAGFRRLLAPGGRLFAFRHGLFQLSSGKAHHYWGRRSHPYEQRTAMRAAAAIAHTRHHARFRVPYTP